MPMIGVVMRGKRWSRTGCGTDASRVDLVGLGRRSWWTPVEAQRPVLRGRTRCPPRCRCCRCRAARPVSHTSSMVLIAAPAAGTCCEVLRVSHVVGDDAAERPSWRGRSRRTGPPPWGAVFRRFSVSFSAFPVGVGRRTWRWPGRHPERRPGPAGGTGRAAGSARDRRGDPAGRPTSTGDQPDRGEERDRVRLQAARGLWLKQPEEAPFLPGLDRIGRDGPGVLGLLGALPQDGEQFRWLAGDDLPRVIGLAAWDLLGQPVSMPRLQRGLVLRYGSRFGLSRQARCPPGSRAAGTASGSRPGSVTAARTRSPRSARRAGWCSHDSSGALRVWTRAARAHGRRP